MTWSTREEDSLSLNLLTSNPLAENMLSDGTDVPGILRYWRTSIGNLGYLILFSFHHFKGFTLGSHLSRLYNDSYVSSYGSSGSSQRSEGFFGAISSSFTFCFLHGCSGMSSNFASKVSHASFFCSSERTLKLLYLGSERDAITSWD